ncbi:MAG: ABC transporter substrate-binding protein [Candidatus Aminicenantes bacterium]|nr:ABC transporter substrate-binding protein [Candidatus Aminicenantes bacterium]
MKRRAAFLLLTATTVLRVFAAQAQTVKDDRGRPFPLPLKPPERIVSLAPNITEILFALGLGERLVGVTRFCDYPPEALTKTKVGGLVDPSFESIQALHPDLVIAFRGNPLRAVERLQSLRLPVFVLDIGRSLDDLFVLIERLGAITGRAEAAAGLNEKLRADDRRVREALAGAGEGPKVFLVLHGQGLWTCGHRSYLHDLIVRAGGRNVAAGIAKDWAFYSRERLLQDNPDVILVLARSPEEFARARAWLAGPSRLGEVRAVRDGRVHRLDQNAASRFCPRLMTTLREVAALLHPERFGRTP